MYCYIILHVVALSPLAESLCPEINKKYNFKDGPGSSVGIANDHGLEDPGIECRWGEFFRPSGPELGPTLPPVQWVLGLFLW